MNMRSFRLYVTLSAFSIMLTTHQINAEEDKSLCSALNSCWNAVTTVAHTVENTITTEINHLIESIENLFGSSSPAHPNTYDVTLVGFVNAADGIGRHPILFKNCLGNTVRINFMSTRDIPQEQEDAQLGLPRLDQNDPNTTGNVAILTDILADEAVQNYKKMPNSPIKIAYTMFESSEIPAKWIEILNTKFDLAVVPDEFLVSVYKSCGVTIPLFVLPLPLDLNDFLQMKQQTKSHTPFVFGMTGGFWPRKNHIGVLDAFAAEFGNNPNVKLKLHGRFGEQHIIDTLKAKIDAYGLTNVELIVKPLSHQEYLDFFASLDCYVFLSMGEGFSITPREALACGKPCILTNNTAQMTICASGFVFPVATNTAIPALYDCHDDEVQGIANGPISGFYRTAQIGYQFTCSIDDARAALREVYTHYHDYLSVAQQGREWVKQYLAENLGPQYLGLVKPQSLLYGHTNMLIDNGLITNSFSLYSKYQNMLES